MSLALLVLVSVPSMRGTRAGFQSWGQAGITRGGYTQLLATSSHLTLQGSRGQGDGKAGKAFMKHKALHTPGYFTPVGTGMG